MALPLDVAVRIGRQSILDWLESEAKKIPMPEGWTIDRVTPYPASGMVLLECSSPAFTKVQYELRFEVKGKRPIV